MIGEGDAVLGVLRIKEASHPAGAQALPPNAGRGGWKTAVFGLNDRVQHVQPALRPLAGLGDRGAVIEHERVGQFDP
ncbi:MAG: hypothetical protein BWY06_02539 [Candidatus Latescibacteria bacterium ADurb.Bin168]|nr:MAG: hypothetical protein BWY06_02539 [Candidatus Latescibacteria bacterium ADurb.Bin168]